MYFGFTQQAKVGIASHLSGIVAFAQEGTGIFLFCLFPISLVNQLQMAFTKKVPRAQCTSWNESHTDILE